MLLRTTPFARLLLFVSLLASTLSFMPLRAEAQELGSGDSPAIGAQSAIVVEYPSGRILYAKNEHERMAPASLTKIMTAILALEYGSPTDQVIATDDDIVGESSMGLVSGEKQALHDLMYGMMLPSGNDAAMAIARHLGSTVGAGMDLGNADPIGRFAVMMNVRVQQLGLVDTHFLNPHGLDADGHYSTAYDLASMSWYALHLPDFNSVVRESYYEAPGHPVLNTNEMLTRYEGADGIKTGWTDGCGLCLVTSASRNGHRLISVVLNAPRWWQDSADILDYGFAKLAIAPGGASDPSLGVSQSGVVSSLLANPAAALPLPAPLAQGGGPGIALAEPETGDVAQEEPIERAPVSATLGVSEGVNLMWVFALATLAGAGCLLIVRGLGPRFSLPLPAGLTLRVKKQKSRVHRVPVPEPPVASIGPSQLARRREPNLLLRAEDACQLHVERALVLAQQGKQGSSISEFLQAMRAGGPLDVGVLTEHYQLCAEAFLALARAQVASGDPASARRTLLHGVLVLPHERTLRVALYRMPPEEMVG